jgi:hypothetical protein
MPNKVQLERHFLNFVANETNYKQVKSILRLVNRSQYMVLREITRNILQGTIDLQSSTLELLQKRKSFIRQLDVGKVSEQELATNSDVLGEIVHLGLQYHALDEYSRCDDNGRVEQSSTENK